MKQLLSFVFFVVCLFTAAHSQTKQYQKIRVTEEQGIKDLYANSKENLEGYRIQVFTGNTSEREEAQSIKEFVESNYEVNAYVEYEAPLFKVRVGDFVDKLEAIALKHELGKHYPNTYIIKTRRINL